MGIVARVLGWVWRRWADYQSVVAILDVLDFKTAIGGGVGFVAMTFLGATNMEWSAPTVVLAGLVAGALVSIILVAVRVLLRSGSSPTSQRAEWPLTLNEKASDLSLVDAESIQLAGVVGALMEAALSWSFKLPLPADDIWIKRFVELRDSAHPIWTDDHVRRLRIEFLQYCGIVGKPLGDAHETISDRRTLDGFGRQLISLLKGEQLTEEGDNTAASLDRISMTELMKIAKGRGWDFTSHDSLHLLDLQKAIRQRASDNHLTVWGRLNRWSNEGLLRNEILEKIPPEHWSAFYVHLFPALDGDNFHTKSWTPSEKPQNYLDLHVNRPEAATWLDRDAAAFRGKTTSKQKGLP
jgi:hypothetical protein